MYLTGAAAQHLLNRHRMPSVFGVTVGVDAGQVLLEAPTRHLRLTLAIDRERTAPVLSLSELDGVGRTEHVVIDTLHGLHNYQVIALANALELPRACWHPLADAAQHMYRVFVAADVLTITLDPISFEPAGRLVLLEAAIHTDDSAHFRHPDFAIVQSTETDDERLARIAGISYVRLDGQIGCIANGAGLAMATIDLIAASGYEYGLRAANFMDIGSGARADSVETALRILLQYHDLRAIVVNFFGGLTRGDEIAQGVIAACGDTPLQIPIVLRLHGTLAQAARSHLDQVDLPGLRFATALSEAVDAAVEAARS